MGSRRRGRDRSSVGTAGTTSTATTPDGTETVRSKAKPKHGGTAKNKAKPKRKTPRRPDPSDTEDAEVRFVQPYQATKTYLCPGCNGDIPQGMGHMVAVPPDAPDLRRHWHRGCWNNRGSRR